jgi:2-haloalkanoic acid dehalogenase type II
MIKALIFDFYGTLVSTGTGSIDAVSKILEKNNSDIEKSQFYSRWKDIQKEYIQSLNHFVSEEKLFYLTLQELYSEVGIKGNAIEDVQIMIETLGKRIAFPETNSTLIQLREKYKIYIGSTTDDVPFYMDLRRNDIQVDRIFTSEDLGIYKPHSKFYTTILEQIGCAANQACFIGDSLDDDVKGPQAVGLNTVWVNRKKKVLSSIIERPTYVITDLSGLLQIF